MSGDPRPLWEREVPSEFPKRKPESGGVIAFVGEAPSDREVERGSPFVGPAGGVFNAALRAANIDREACYVGNVFSTMLRGNDMGRHREFLGAAWPEFQARNLARLRDELARVDPTVIVPMGDTALWHLAGMQGITAHRGAPTLGRGIAEGRKLLPTLHPAAIIYTWKHFAVLIADVIRAAREAEIGPEIVYPKRSLLIQPTIEEVEETLRVYTQKCAESGGLLTADIETGWGFIRGIAFAPNAEEAIYVPFVSLANTSRSYWRDEKQEVRAWAAVKAALESPVPKLGQNFANYDAVWLLRKAGIRVMNLREDTRLLHAALYPELPKSLAFMSQTYGSQGVWKTWAKHGGGRKKDLGDKRDA